jgi:hypothetical protein
MSKLIVALIPAFMLALSGCNKQPTQAQQPQAAPPAVKPVALKVTPVAKTYDGPFGLASGMSIAEIQELGFKEVDGVKDVYFGKAPKPVEGIDDYTVVAAPKAGVCTIQATALVGVVNGSGDQVREKVDGLAEAMEVKYGKPTKKINYYGEDVYKRNPQYWMMGLKEDSVIYGYVWKVGQQEPNGLKSIEITAGASSSDSGYATIRYRYNNLSLCQKEFKEQKAASF